MDFAGWIEAYLGGHWYTFNPRNNVPRIGHVLIGRGRDAADVPITLTFGPNTGQLQGLDRRGLLEASQSARSPARTQRPSRVPITFLLFKASGTWRLVRHA
jgi:hypothetical protein